MMMSCNELPEFTKEFKRLSKKFRSLAGDLQEFKKVLSAVPLGTGRHFNVLAQTDKVKIVKARLFCRYLKRDSLRIIYSYSESLGKVDFVEIYFKGDKENEDRTRIKEYLKKCG